MSKPLFVAMNARTTFVGGNRKKIEKIRRKQELTLLEVFTTPGCNSVNVKVVHPGNNGFLATRETQTRLASLLGDVVKGQKKLEQVPGITILRSMEKTAVPA